jgi:GMP synthase (glutamine-hydrolysing)
MLVLRCGDAVPIVAARRGEFFRWIKDGVGDAFRGEWIEHDARTGGPMPEADAVIITGSAANVSEGLPWMRRAEASLRDLVERDVPILGICFGHQLLASALGGRVEKNPSGREIGTVKLSLNDDAHRDPLFAGLGPVIDVNMTHVETVTVLPPKAKVLAKTDLEPHAAFRIEGKRTWGVQFHPEIDGDAMRGYIAAREHLLRSEGLPFERILGTSADTPAGVAVLRAFARTLR